MRFLRQFTHGAVVSLLGTAIVLGISVYALIMPLSNQDTVEQWLVDAEIYDNVTDVFIEQTKNPEDGGESLESQFQNSVVPIEVVYDAARDTFSPAFWQTNVESAIDNTYAWLAGEESLNFEINIGEQSDAFVEAIEQQAVQEYSSLPQCSLEQLQNFNLKEAACLPPGILTTQAASQFVNDFKSEDAPLADASIDASSFEISPEEEATIRDAYYLASISQWIALGLIVTLSALAIVSAKTIINGVRRVGHVLIIGGVFSTISFLILNNITGNINLSEDAATQAETTLMDSIVQPFVQTALEDVGSRGIVASATVAILGLLLWTGAYLVHHRSHKPKKSDTEITQKEDDAPATDS